MTRPGLNILFALTILLKTAQATSLLDYYEAKVARPWGAGQLICPSEDGVFEKTEDCFNFFSYLCKVIGDSQSNCSEEYRKKCLTAINSICEERDKITTSLPSTTSEPTTINLITTPEETTVQSTTTPEPTIRTQKPTSSKPIKPTGPPETTCPDDDLDCIVDDTGVTPDWFNCPEDIGSYPHPLSNKLFIFCLNWKPSVKRCGKNLVYSVKLRTCVNPGAEYAYNLFTKLK